MYRHYLCSYKWYQARNLVCYELCAYLNYTPMAICISFYLLLLERRLLFSFCFDLCFRCFFNQGFLDDDSQDVFYRMRAQYCPICSFLLPIYWK
jgi:hypothetical protein